MNRPVRSLSAKMTAFRFKHPRLTAARPMLISFVLVFAAIGTYTLIRSFAATPPTYDNVVLGDNPVAYWAMNNAGGNESDLSGHSNTGTYKGGAPTMAKLPNGDQAADFNGSSQYMTVPSNSSFSIPTSHKLTWEAWIRPDVLQYPKESDPDGYGYVDWMGKCADYSPSCEWESRMYSTTNSEGRCNRLSAYVFNKSAGLGSGADWQPVCNMLQANQWLHVVGEYQTDAQPTGCKGPQIGGINIWVDGVKWNQSYHLQTGCMSQYGITPTAGNSPLNIGSMALDTWFKGAVGKVAIYNYLLDQTQITAHFAAMTGAQPSGNCANTCTTPVPTQTTAPASTAPTVSIASPANNAKLSGAVKLSAQASADNGISKVEFYDGVTRMGTATTAPYTTLWDTTTVPDGAHTIIAKAYDSSGNVGTSQAVAITIANHAADTSLPSAPSDVRVVTQTSSSVSLGWAPSSDNVGVTGYKVYRYGPTTSSATTSGTSFTDNGLAADTSYTYTVSALDAAGNESPQSAPVAAKTSAASTAPTSAGLAVTLVKGATWSSGYCSNVNIKNTSTKDIKGWTVSFQADGHITSLWSANWSQSGATTTISNVSWNATIKAGQTYSGVGFCASKSR